MLVPGQALPDDWQDTDPGTVVLLLQDCCETPAALWLSLPTLPQTSNHNIPGAVLCCTLSSATPSRARQHCLVCSATHATIDWTMCLCNQPAAVALLCSGGACLMGHVCNPTQQCHRCRRWRSPRSMWVSIRGTHLPASARTGAKCAAYWAVPCLVLCAELCRTSRIVLRDASHSIQDI